MPPAVTPKPPIAQGIDIARANEENKKYFEFLPIVLTTTNLYKCPRTQRSRQCLALIPPSGDVCADPKCWHIDLIDDGTSIRIICEVPRGLFSKTTSKTKYTALPFDKKLVEADKTATRTTIQDIQMTHMHSDGKFYARSIIPLTEKMETVEPTIGVRSGGGMIVYLHLKGPQTEYAMQMAKMRKKSYTVTEINVPDSSDSEDYEEDDYIETKRIRLH